MKYWHVHTKEIVNMDVPASSLAFHGLEVYTGQDQAPPSASSEGDVSVVTLTPEDVANALGLDFVGEEFDTVESLLTEAHDLIQSLKTEVEDLKATAKDKKK